MAQYYGSCLPRSYDYWKVSTEEPSDDAGRKYLSTLLPDYKLHERSDLNRVRSRYHRNMLIYESCTEKELRQFCKNRGLKWRAPREVGLYNDPSLRLRLNLEKHDENWVFERFLDLPAELRVLVYEQLFDSYKLRKGHEMPPPPIAQVSKLLRKECLSIFYKDPPTYLDLRHSNHWSPISGGNVHFLKLIDRLEIWSSWRVSVTFTLGSVEVDHRNRHYPSQRVSASLIQQRAEAFLAVLEKRAGSRSSGSLGLQQGDTETLQKIFDPDIASLQAEGLFIRAGEN